MQLTEFFQRGAQIWALAHVSSYVDVRFLLVLRINIGYHSVHGKFRDPFLNALQLLLFGSAHSASLVFCCLAVALFEDPACAL